MSKKSRYRAEIFIDGEIMEILEATVPKRVLKRWAKGNSEAYKNKNTKIVMKRIKNER